MKLARRMQEIAPFHVMELVARAKELEAQGCDIVHMEVGEPDFPTPEPITAAAQAFLRDGKVFYTSALGLPALREAIARFYGERYKLNISPERIIITTGASAALMLALGVLIDRDDELLLPDPGYPCNRHFVRLLEGRPIALKVGPESAYQPTPAQVSAAWTANTRGLLVASPSNPTGTMLKQAELSALHQCIQQRGGNLLVDEIYHGLTYGIEASSALAVAEDLFVINSFSKYFNMTGWRLGWLVAPQQYVREIEKLAQNLYIAPPTLAQHAALAAFAPETITILEARRAEYAERRKLLLEGLTALGFEIKTEPQGAFYLYADVSKITSDSFPFATQLLEQAGVAATPGIDFGDNQPERHMRFAYTVASDRLHEGLRRIAEFVQRSK